MADYRMLVFAGIHANQMVDMLRDAVMTGTARGAQLGKREVAGKTGTSQDHRDAWFIGFSADYTAGVWLGNDDNSTMNKVTGGLLPADVWKNFMRVVHKNVSYKPLLPEEESSENEDEQRRMNFYADLTSQFLTERNLAAGINRPIVSDPPSSESANAASNNTVGGR